MPLLKKNQSHALEDSIGNVDPNHTTIRIFQVLTMEAIMEKNQIISNANNNKPTVMEKTLAMIMRKMEGKN